MLWSVLFLGKDLFVKAVSQESATWPNFQLSGALLDTLVPFGNGFISSIFFNDLYIMPLLIRSTELPAHKAFSFMKIQTISKEKNPRDSN